MINIGYSNLNHGGKSVSRSPNWKDLFDTSFENGNERDVFVKL